MAKTGELLIVGVIALMATTLVVVTQAQSAELDGLQQCGCPLIWYGACVRYLTGMGPMEDCCDILAVMHKECCQCWVMETISNGHIDVDREYARNLPMKCGTLKKSCSFKMPYINM